MQEMTAHSWKRRGCSLVWSPDLLRDLITGIEATPLNVALEWQRSGFPDDTPSGANTVLLGGLQTVLNTMPDAETSYAWLREYSPAVPTMEQPLGRRWAWYLEWTVRPSGLNRMSPTTWSTLAASRNGTRRCV